jgi:hypothetical protein
MMTNDDFNGLVAQTLNRMDTKDETAAEAAEAVTGGNRELDARIVRALQGEPEPKFTVGTRVRFIGNGVTQEGVVTKVRKNGNVVVKTEDRIRASDGRRLEAGQNWTITPDHQLAFFTIIN